MQVCNLDAFYTDLMWYPVSSKKNQAGGTDVFAVSCTDGESRVGFFDSKIHRGGLSECMATLFPSAPGLWPLEWSLSTPMRSS